MTRATPGFRQDQRQRIGWEVRLREVAKVDLARDCLSVLTCRIAAVTGGVWLNEWIALPAYIFPHGEHARAFASQVDAVDFARFR